MPKTKKKSRVALEAIGRKLFEKNGSLKEIDSMNNLSEEEKSIVHNAYKGQGKDYYQRLSKKRWEKLANDNKYRME